MKIYFLVLTVIAVVNTKDVIQQNQPVNSDAIIRQLLEMLKYFIKNGSGENDSRIIDPFEFDFKYYKFTLPNKLLSLQAGFMNGVLTGLGNFDVQNTEFIKDDIAIKLSINFPLIIFKSESYEMNGDISEILPIDGRGKFEFEIQNLTFSGKVFLKQSDDERSILIKNIIQSQFSIQQIVSRVDFDGNIDEIANAVITELLANYLTRFNQFILKNYAENLINLTNPFLNNFDSWRILACNTTLITKCKYI